MIIEKYSDLEKVEDNMIVDLTKLSPRLATRALDFLAGLTCKNGSLTKLENNKFLVKI
mgnify:CR=1 FL=1